MANRFNFKLPDGWQDETVHRFKGPEDSGVEHALTLVVDRSAGRAKVEDYARERIDASMEAMQPSEILNEGPKQLGSGVSAYEAVIKWVPVDDEIIFRKLTFVIDSGTGLMFAANFSKKTIKTIGHDVDRIIDSIVSG
jgi:hypothetical protein